METLKTTSMLVQAEQCIQRFSADMKHHILKHDYFKDKDPVKALEQSRYVELVDGLAKEVQILGHFYEGGKAN